jgi:hypothetical protein|nr:MAG TPA: hypothetical protein [Caudoviricetes sp.]
MKKDIKAMISYLKKEIEIVEFQSSDIELKDGQYNKTLVNLQNRLRFYQTQLKLKT